MFEGIFFEELTGIPFIYCISMYFQSAAKNENHTKPVFEIPLYREGCHGLGVNLSNLSTHLNVFPVTIYVLFV